MEFLRIMENFFPKWLHRSNSCTTSSMEGLLRGCFSVHLIPTMNTPHISSILHDSFTLGSKASAIGLSSWM
uniref:Uncharacterized protein n=1 Tax=Cannabis sativa TaxID=3483 RepID=A0A803QSY7_CANSA